MKRLRHDYTAEQLDRGEWMDFHPCSGHRRRGGSFSTPLPSQPAAEFEASLGFYWYHGCYGDGVTWPRIGDGQPRRKGDPYPAHWDFDPYTGEKLVKHVALPMPRPFLTGWEVD